MTPADLSDLTARGWRLTRDGSTGTAFLAWDDPDDPDSGWEIYVLRTEGHANRLTVNEFGSGLTERAAADAHRLLQALQEAVRLVDGWQGELVGEKG